MDFGTDPEMHSETSPKIKPLSPPLFQVSRAIGVRLLSGYCGARTGVRPASPWVALEALFGAVSAVCGLRSFALRELWQEGLSDVCPPGLNFYMGVFV